MLSGFLLGLDALNWSTRRALIGLGQVWFTMRVTLVNTALNLILGVALVLLVGFIGVPVAALLSLLATLPWLYRGLQPGALRRILRSAAWIGIPVIAAILAGLAVHLIAAPLAVKAIGTTAAVTLVYGGVAWLAGPDWLKKKVAHGAVHYRKKLTRAGQPVLP
jgi:O-antigen/teichoic acid export membrane protein